MLEIGPIELSFNLLLLLLFRQTRRHAAIAVVIMVAITPLANYPLSPRASVAAQYVGQKLADLPTPAVVLDYAIVRRNCDAMLRVCGELGVGFRAHVKSHKVYCLNFLICIWFAG